MSLLLFYNFFSAAVFIDQAPRIQVGWAKIVILSVGLIQAYVGLDQEYVGLGLQAYVLEMRLSFDTGRFRFLIFLKQHKKSQKDIILFVLKTTQKGKQNKIPLEKKNLHIYLANNKICIFVLISSYPTSSVSFKKL